MDPKILKELIGELAQFDFPDRQPLGKCDYEWHEAIKAYRSDMCPACGAVGGYGFEPSAKHALEWRKIDPERFSEVARTGNGQYELRVIGKLSDDDINQLRCFLNQGSRTEISWEVTYI